MLSLYGKKTLNNDVEIPMLGYGTWQSPDDDFTATAVASAIMSGYRHIDCAAVYGNEKSVGKAICKCGTDRKELFITSKVWNSAQGYETTLHAFDKTLSDLELDYLDLYLIHWPIPRKHDDDWQQLNRETWRAMEKLYREGRVRAIGVSNFMPDRLADLIQFNEIVPAVNQVETNPFNQQIEAEVFMKEKGVQIESWAPFAEGKNDLFRNETLAAIADKYHKSIAQVVLRWLIQRNVVVIPKSIRKERIIENFNVFDFELAKEDMEKIAALDTKTSCFFSHRDPKMVEWLGGLH